MDSVLIVSDSEKTQCVFEELLNINTYKTIVTAKSCSEASRLLIEDCFDLCIINTPLPDEFGVDFALDITKRLGSQVMLIVKSEFADEISDKVEDYGIFVVSKPINKQVFCTALKLMSATHKRLKGLQNENVLLQKKIDDIRFIDRAKCALIAYLKMSEPEAHKYIEKQAMDMRITKREVAAGILKTYEP